MSPNAIPSLVSKLCIELGFNLGAHDVAVLRKNPPTSADEFIRRVFEAEGMSPADNLRLTRKVRDLVEEYFINNSYDEE